MDASIATVILIIIVTLLLSTTSQIANPFSQKVETTSMQRKAITLVDLTIKKCGQTPQLGAAFCKNQKLYSHIIDFEEAQEETTTKSDKKACVKRLVLKKNDDFNEYRVGKLNLEKKVLVVCS